MENLSDILVDAARRHDQCPSADGVCHTLGTTSKAMNFFRYLFIPKLGDRSRKRGYWMTEADEPFLSSYENKDIRNRRVLALLFAAEFAKSEGK